jgi:putative transposase
MRGSRYSEEQIVALLKEQEAGVATDDICRRAGISQQTFYRWKAKYGGLEVGDARKLKTLEDENRRLKRLVADLALDNAALKDVVSKNW